MQNRGFAGGARLFGRHANLPDLNLVMRAASAIVLAMVALTANFLGVQAFAFLVTLLAVLMCWEWGQVVRQGRQPALLAVHAASVVIAALLSVSDHLGLGLLALGAGALVTLGLDNSSSSRLSTFGVGYIGLPVALLIWIRGDDPLGAVAILFLFAVVWATDTGAFAAGRVIGGAKLWPRVSPNKTWAGFAGGLAVSALFAIAFVGFLPQPASPAWLALIGLIFGVCAQAGDLGESALKRFCGVKDASELIPGHGGFMDRLDSLVAVAVAGGIVGAILNSGSPARGILFGL